MSKFEDLGVPLIDANGREIPGATLITSETIALHDAKETVKGASKLAAATLAFTMAFSHAPTPVQRGIEQAGNAVSAAIDHIPVVNDVVDAATRTIEAGTAWTASQFFPEATIADFNSDSDSDPKYYETLVGGHIDQKALQSPSPKE